jgi:hypothetical protein
MSHAYVINSVSVLGDALTVTGTVDGMAVTVNTWVSAVGNAMASAIAFRNFIIPLMLAAVPAAPVLYPGLNMSFTA